MISLAVSLRVMVPVLGARSVAKVIAVFDALFNFAHGRIPCANTIDLWVRKCGLGIYQNSAQEFSGQDYCLIADESMMIGSVKLLVILAARAWNAGRPLTHDDVSVVGISVAASFSGESIRRELEAAAERIGHAPEYVITDNASIMTKAASLAGVRHHPDISHTIGVYLEHAYKEEEDFKQYCKLMSGVVFRKNMKQVAYILPPRQRTIARFINMSQWVKWSGRVLQVFPKLGDAEKEALMFVPQNASLVEELSDTIGCIDTIEKEIKHNGLSADTARHCMSLVKKTLYVGNERMRKVGEDIELYLRKESGWIGDEAHNCSSDILESTFGYFKLVKSPNKLYGVTTMVLHIPVREKIGSLWVPEERNIIQHVEAVRCRDIKQWKDDNLPRNLVTVRNRTLNES